MGEEKQIVYDFYMLDDGGYDYEPIILLKNGEVEDEGDSTHNPYLEEEITAYLKAATEFSKGGVVVNKHAVTKENVSDIENGYVRETFSLFLNP